jgi:hypothetical protein
LVLGGVIGVVGMRDLFNEGLLRGEDDDDGELVRLLLEAFFPSVAKFPLVRMLSEDFFSLKASRYNELL